MSRFTRRPATAKRKKVKLPPAPTGASPPTAPASLRLSHRALLGAVTALIVVRPLVPGEDPGRLLPWTGVSGQVVLLLWLVAAVGWGAWRAMPGCLGPPVIWQSMRR